MFNVGVWRLLFNDPVDIGTLDSEKRSSSSIGTSLVEEWDSIGECTVFNFILVDFAISQLLCFLGSGFTGCRSRILGSLCTGRFSIIGLAAIFFFVGSGQIFAFF